MIDGLAVNHRASATGVVGDHAAQSCPIRSGNVMGKVETRSFCFRIQIIENASGLDSCPALIRIDVQDAVEIFGAIDLQAWPNGLSRLRGATASDRYRHAKLSADFHDGNDVFF